MRARAAIVAGLVLFLSAVGAGDASGAGRNVSPQQVSGSGGVRIDGELVGPDAVWAEYRYRRGVKEVVHAKPSDGVDGEALEQAVRHVTTEALIRREAARLGFVVDADDRARLRVRQVAAWRGEDGFQVALKMLNVDEGFMIRRVESELLGQRIVERHLASQPAAGDEELRAFHRNNPGRYLTPGKPALRYIRLPRDTDPLYAGTTPWNFIASRVADGAAALRARGETYESLVRELSRHPGAAAGGIVDERPAAGAALPFQNAAPEKECRLSRAFGDADGFHIYLRDCRTLQPFEDVRDRVVADHRAAVSLRYLQDLAARLEKTATVEFLVLPDGVSPPAGGASHR